MKLKKSDFQQSDKDSAIVSAIVDLIDKQRAKTSGIRAKWKENFEVFQGGSSFDEKEDWQSDFSVNEVGSAIRTGVTNIKSNFLKRADWFALEGLTAEAKQWEPILDKILRMELRRAKFERSANTFLLLACIMMGVEKITYTLEKIQNPRLAMAKAREEMEKFAKENAGELENPPPLPSAYTDPEQLFANMDTAITELLNSMTDERVKRDEIPEFRYRRRLHIQPVDPLAFFWDTDTDYMEEANWHAEETWCPIWKIRDMQKSGIYNPKIEVLAYRQDEEKKIRDARFKNEQSIDEASNTTHRQSCHIIEYFGDVVVDNERVLANHHLVILNKKYLLLSKPNTFWGIRGKSPYIAASINEVPFKPTGQGMADNATGLQRVLDSNYHLTTDQMRLSLVGINVVDRTKLLDPSILEEGIAPGKFLETVGEPDKVFKHHQLTTGVENIVFPMNEIIRQGIQKATGVSPIIQGYANLRSRTSAAEVNSQVSGSEANLFTASEGLENMWLVPFLEHVLGMIIQFGMDVSDPEVIAICEPDELEMLRKLNDDVRFELLCQAFKFEINGFGGENLRVQIMSEINKLLALYNQQGPLTQVLNGPELLRELVNKIGFKNPSKYVIDNSEMDIIESENRLLMNGHHVQVGQQDNDEFHLKSHSQALMLMGGNTPEMQTHIQQHQIRMQQMQQMQAAQAQGAQPARGQSQVNIQ